MSSASRSTAALVAVVVLLVGAAGCGSNPKPKSLPDPSPTPSSSAATLAPAIPAEAGTKNRTGVEASLRYFLAVMAYAGSSGDSETFREAFTKNCTRCAAIADGIDKTYASGGHIKGGAWRATRLDFHGISNGVAYVDARLTFAEQEFKADKSSKTQVSRATRDNLRTFQMTFAGSRWRVAALDPDQ